MTEPRWLPTEAEIKIHMARQREERVRMSQRVDDGPQTILMPKGATPAQRAAFLPPQDLKGVDRPRRDWLPLAAVAFGAAALATWPLLAYLWIAGGAK